MLFDAISPSLPISSHISGRCKLMHEKFDATAAQLLDAVLAMQPTCPQDRSWHVRDTSLTCPRRPQAAARSDARGVAAAALAGGAGEAVHHTLHGRGAGAGAGRRAAEMRREVAARGGRTSPPRSLFLPTPFPPPSTGVRPAPGGARVRVGPAAARRELPH